MRAGLDRILITGSAGFIGSNLKKRFPDATGIDIKDSETTDIIQDVCTYSEAGGFDVIYHMAAKAMFDEYMRDPVEAFRTNVYGTINLLKQFKGRLFIYPSCVGAGNRDQWDEPYILSKVVCEKIVENSGKPYVIFRFANVYGERSNGVVWKFINEPEINIHGSGEQVRDFILIDDLIEALSISEQFARNQTFYIGSGTATSINKLAEIVIRLQGEKPVKRLPRRVMDVDFPIIKADYHCKTNLEEGIRRMLERG